jgi:hypothetical protein
MSDLKDEWTEGHDGTYKTWTHPDYGVIVNRGFRTFKAYTVDEAEIGIYKTTDAAFEASEKFYFGEV